MDLYEEIDGIPRHVILPYEEMSNPPRRLPLQP